MSAARVRPLVAKEIHALLPAWIGAAIAIGAAVLNGPRSHELGLIAYGFGSVVLGAQSIGHEYTHRTMAQLLSQPWSRGRILAVKFAVLTTMVATLAALAWLALLQPGEQYWVFATLLNSLCVAPLLTMAARDPLAGVVFTGAAPVWLLVIGRYISARALWAGTFIVAAAAALAAWRMFMRLEAIDGRGAEVRAPDAVRRWLTATFVASEAPVRRKRPVWMLVKKELRLQQMTFAVGAVWVAFWIATFTLGPMIPMFTAFPVGMVGVLYGGLLAVLIGALASAEERQLGTLEWQLLQPLAAWQQWAVKVATAIVLALVLSFALPVVFAAGQIGFSPGYAALILTLTIGSLYVSSLCRNSIRALTIAGPIVLGLTASWTYAAGIYSIGDHGQHLLALTTVPLVAVIALLLWFGFENHRTAVQDSGRTARQVLWMAGCVALGVAVAWRL